MVCSGAPLHAEAGILLDIAYGYFRISKLDMQMEMLQDIKVGYQSLICKMERIIQYKDYACHKNTGFN